MRGADNGLGPFSVIEQPSKENSMAALKVYPGPGVKSI